MKKSNAGMLRNIIIVLAVSCVAMIGATPLFADIFGYETAGGSMISNSDCIVGSWFTAPENGTADSITVSIVDFGGVDKTKCAIYLKSDNSLVGETEEKDAGGSTQHWETFNFLTSPSISANTDYYLVCWSDMASFTIIYYNCTGSNTGAGDYETYGDWPDTWNPGWLWGPNCDRTYSIYCSYTPGGGGSGGGAPEMPAGAVPFVGAILGFVYVTIRGSRRK